MEDPELDQVGLDSHPLVLYLLRERPESGEQVHDALRCYVDCVNAYLDVEVFFVCQIDRTSSGVVCECGWWLGGLPGVEWLATQTRGLAWKMLWHYETHCPKPSGGGMVLS
jgi:hypothetical protein